MLSARALVLATAVAVAAGGCGGTSGDSSPIADGRYFAFIRAADTSGSQSALTVDTADFLTGDAANRAAAEDGVIEEGESVPNDYYIRNGDESTVELRVASAVRVTHIQCVAECREGIAGDFEAFVRSFDVEEPSLADEYRGPHSQYWITVEDGAVASIDEQYLP